jgi:uncharacterized damage-inducible protein DinB
MAAKRARSTRARRGGARGHGAGTCWRGTPAGPPLPRALPAAFVRLAAELLAGTYLPRIARAVDELPARDLWWRPHARTTSVGNLLLHLEGNLRQWILDGLAGAPDRRDRDAEFAAREGEPARVLLARLSATVRHAAALFGELDEAALRGRVTVQGFRVTRLEAVLHVVEHMSWHAGQIAWIAKARAGERHRLAYYRDAGLRTPGLSAAAPRRSSARSARPRGAAR